MAKTFDNRDVSYNKGKTLNLSQKQLKKAGAAKAAKKSVSISSTKRVTSGVNKGKTVGPGGKPLNGTVTLPSGAKAVYKDGKRVAAVKAASKPAPSSSRSTPSKSPSKPPASPPSGGPKSGAAARKEQNRGVKNGTIREGAAGKGVRKYNAKTGRWEKVNQAGLGGTAKIAVPAKKTSPSASSSSSGKQTPDGRNASNAFSGSRPTNTGNKVADAAVAAQKQGQARKAASDRLTAQAAAAKKSSSGSSSTSKPTTAKDVWDKSPHGMVVNAVGKVLTGNTPPLKKGDVHYTAIGARYWTGSKWVGAVKKNGKWVPQQ